MLSPDDPASRLIALAILAALLGLFIARAIRKDRLEYRRFRRYRSTRRRQAMMRRWLLESVLVFGGSALALLVVVHPLVGPLLAQAQTAPWIATTRAAIGSPLGAALAIAAGLVAIAATAAGLRGARRTGGVVMVGDIASLLPRNRPELGWGAALSVTAGVVEELLFRLALPALLFVVTGEALSALALAVLVFGALHVYQGVTGVLGTVVVGLLLTIVYVLSGSIVAAIAVHAAIDLRTLVLVPVAVYSVHRVPGSVRMPPPLTPVRLREPAHPDRS